MNLQLFCENKTEYTDGVSLFDFIAASFKDRISCMLTYILIITLTYIQESYFLPKS